MGESVEKTCARGGGSDMLSLSPKTTLAGGLDDCDCLRGEKRRKPLSAGGGREGMVSSGDDSGWLKS